MPARELFKTIYRSLKILVTLALGGGAILAWWHSTPANQLMLMSGILAILTLMAGLSISKLDDQDAQAEKFRSIFQSIPTVARINIVQAEPEAHHVDAAMLEQAKRMAAEGAAIDDICRAIDPGHDRRDEVSQSAFRALVRLMIEKG